MIITAEELARIENVTTRAIQIRARNLGINKVDGKYVFTPEQAQLISKRTLDHLTQKKEKGEPIVDKNENIAISSSSESQNEQSAKNEQNDFVFDELGESQTEKKQEPEIDFKKSKPKVSEEELFHFQRLVIGYPNKVDELKNLLQKSDIYPNELAIIIQSLDKTIEQINDLAECETRVTYLDI